MIDCNHLPNADQEIWIPGFASDVTTQWKPIILPKQAEYLFITAIGPGGSGRTSTVDGDGGGGGSTGGLSTLLIRARFLPSVLYCSVGLLGTTALAVSTYLSCLPTTNDEDTILYANNGITATARTGASAPAVATLANSDLSSLGISTFYAGLAGANGGTTGSTQGASVAVASSLPMSPGAGGEGGGGSSGSNTGGNQTSSSNLYTTLLGGLGGIIPSNGNFAGGPGADGIFLLRPFICIGGTGGGGNVGINAGDVGGKGGNGGGYGSGGGGGGAFRTAGTGGAGGLGATGLLRIQWW